MRKVFGTGGSQRRKRYNYSDAIYSRWGELIDRYAGRFGVDNELVAAVITHESGGDPNAVSPAGAIGLMQLMPSTAKALGVKKPFDPEENIRGGTKYLRSLLDRFNGDVRLALAAYNAGPGAVRKYKDVPPYAETRNYIKRILGGDPYERSGVAITKLIKPAEIRSTRLIPGMPIIAALMGKTPQYDEHGELWYIDYQPQNAWLTFYPPNWLVAATLREDDLFFQLAGLDMSDPGMPGTYSEDWLARNFLTLLQYAGLEPAGSLF